jgi:hypothetical protein
MRLTNQHTKISLPAASTKPNKTIYRPKFFTKKKKTKENPE